MNKRHNIRISLSLVCLTLLIFFVADWLGLILREDKSLIRERVNISEALAIQFSVVIQQDGVPVIPVTARLVVARNPQIRSILVKDINNQLITSHDSLPSEGNGPISTPDLMKVPLFKNNEQWGFVEIGFIPLQKNEWWDYVNTPFFHLLAFIASFGFIVYFLLVRKVLHHLDPTKIVPLRVRATLNAVTDGMVFIDDEERIVLSNEAFELKMHYSTTQLLGRKLSSLAWVQQEESEENKYHYPWLKTLKTGKICTYTKLGFKTSADKPLSFIVNTTPLEDKVGEVSGVLASFNDVTELEKINRDMESMTQFMRHEMGNALVGAMGTLNLLEQSKQLSEDDKKVLNRTKRLHSVINNLLESVKEAKSIEASFSNEKNKPLNLSRLLADIVTNYSGIFVENEFIFESNNDSLVILGQEERITQMIDKLTTNAIDHATPDTPILYSCFKDKNRAVIKIMNQGKTLPDDKLKIFDLFASYRSDKDKNQNQGIGLYVVKLIANTYGGSVEARDRDDIQGAEFIIRLPLIDN